MSLDRSLKISGSMAATRSVLTRPERLKKLAELRKTDPKNPKALGLPKTRVN
ncbi:MAG: small basic protein [Phycisphaerales bacterium]